MAKVFGLIFKMIEAMVDVNGDDQAAVDEHHYDNDDY